MQDQPDHGEDSYRGSHGLAAGTPGTKTQAVQQTGHLRRRLTPNGPPATSIDDTPSGAGPSRRRIVRLLGYLAIRVSA